MAKIMYAYLSGAMFLAWLIWGLHIYHTGYTPLTGWVVAYGTVFSGALTVYISISNKG